MPGSPFYAQPLALVAVGLIMGHLALDVRVVCLNLSGKCSSFFEGNPLCCTIPTQPDLHGKHVVLFDLHQSQIPEVTLYSSW